MLTPEAAREGAREPARRRAEAAHEGAGGAAGGRGRRIAGSRRARRTTRPARARPTDAEVRTELRAGAQASLASFKKHLNTTAFLQTGPRARVLRDGTAIAPDNAPDVVKRVIMAGNEIAKFPYKWGGGPRRLARQRLRLLGLGLLRAGRRRAPRAAAHVRALHELRRAGPGPAGSRSTPAPATSSCSWPASGSTRAARAARAPAGRRTRARPRASRCGTSRVCSRAQTASSAGSSSSSIRPARAQDPHLDRRADQRPRPSAAGGPRRAR